MIGLNTKLIALPGLPPGRSFSPRMQNETYKALDLDCYYFTYESTEAEPEQIIAGARSRFMRRFLPQTKTRNNKVSGFR